MLYTTIPAFVIALVIYFILGMRYTTETVDSSAVDSILTGLATQFDFSPLISIITLIPLVVVVVLAYRQVSALAVIYASLVGMFIAMIINGYNIYEMMSFMNYGFVIDTEVLRM